MATTEAPTKGSNITLTSIRDVRGFVDSVLPKVAKYLREEKHSSLEHVPSYGLVGCALSVLGGDLKPLRRRNVERATLEAFKKHPFDLSRLSDIPFFEPYVAVVQEGVGKNADKLTISCSVDRYQDLYTIRLRFIQWRQFPHPHTSLTLVVNLPKSEYDELLRRSSMPRLGQ